jgi:hypothetical protein
MVKDLDLSILSLEGLRSRYSKARGMLGEDFLRNFDLLLDNRHRVLHMERGPGRMAEALDGEHVPLSGRGSYLGKPTYDRLMLTLKIPDVTSLPLRVQLDSAACLVFLFKSLALPAGWKTVMVGDARRGRTSMYQRQVESLTVGSSLVQQVTVMTPILGEENDSDGLLPTNLFRSVYISHSGGFAIFNPAVRTALAKALP